MMRRKPIKRLVRRVLTEDEIFERSLHAIDHAVAALGNGYMTREQYNSFMLDLGKWAAGKRGMKWPRNKQCKCE